MNNKVIFVSLLCLLLNSYVATANTGLPTPGRCLPQVQSCPGELPAQADSLINSVKCLVLAGAALFPEFKPAAKPRNNNETTSSLIFSIVNIPQKLNNTTNQTGISAEWLAARRCQPMQHAAFQSKAPPGRGNVIYLFLLVYFILLKKSNLPWRTILPSKYIHPATP